MSLVRTLCCVLLMTGCTMTTLTAQNTPRIGWTGEQVESAIGISYDVTQTASGYESWRYSYDPSSRWVGGSCASRFVRRCMTVYLYQNRVTDVRYP